jgi:hypothetical protein
MAIAPEPLFLFPLKRIDKTSNLCSALAEGRKSTMTK